MIRRRVLLVEDEALVAMLVEEMLTELGYEVVGTAGRLSQALRLAENVGYDVAVLDVNLDGVFTYPVADLLQRRGIPFAFITGYGASGLDPCYAHFPTLQKPFRARDLNALLRSVLASKADPS